MRTQTITNPNASPAAGADPKAPPVRPIPFTRASIEATQPVDLDRSNVIAAGQVTLGPVDVPAYGFMRSIWVRVDATGGTGTAALYKEDAPWSAIAEAALLDVNGQAIVQLGGYELYLANRWGGVAWNPDAGLTNSPQWVASTTAGNFSFALRLPVEVAIRDALGALNNMNASATYKLRITQAANTDIYSANPTGAPTMRVRATLEAWAPVPASDGQGHPQATYPYAAGTTSYWTRQQFTINGSGTQPVRLARVGNLIRTLILILRTTAPARSDTNYPDPIQLLWDSLQVYNESPVMRRQIMREHVGSSSGDTGVLVYDFAHDFDGHTGQELRDGWLATALSSRVEFQGSWGAAGTLTVITNDIVPVGNPFTD